MADDDDWDQPERLRAEDRLAAEALIVDVDGFEGPLDLLLTLSPHAEGGPAPDLGAATGRTISGLCRTGAQRCGSNLRRIIW